MDLWYDTAKAVVRAYLALFIRSIQVEGIENLPPGPKIIVANHPNATDGFVLPFIIREKVHILIQEDTFHVPVIGRLLALADQIPVAYGRGREALNTALDKLALGHAVVIFPEGRLNHNREFRRAGTGAAILALESGAPLIPLGFYVPDKYTRAIQTYMHNRITFGRWQFGGHTFVRIGEPWQPLVDEADRGYRYVRELTQNLMAQVAGLVDQAKAEADKLGI